MTAQPISVDLSPVEQAWTLGHASGLTWAAWLGTSLQDVALRAIAEARPHAVYGSTADEVLGGYYNADEAARLQRVFTSAALLAWAEETSERPDAEQCQNCWLRVLTDLEESFHCAAYEHGVTCSEVCRDERCRQPRCEAEL